MMIGEIPSERRRCVRIFRYFLGRRAITVDHLCVRHHALYQRLDHLQLLTVVIPHLSKLAKEGERGRKKIIQYTRFGTIGIALIQGFGIAVGLEGMNKVRSCFRRDGHSADDGDYLHGRHRLFNVAGRTITERGIGNGISLIIFAGIVARCQMRLPRL